MQLLDTQAVGVRREKMYRLDDHIAAAVAGITADANILVNTCRLQAQRYLFTYQVRVSGLAGVLTAVVAAVVRVGCFACMCRVVAGMLQLQGSPAPPHLHAHPPACLPGWLAAGADAC